MLLDQVASSRCNAVCPGNNKQKCGGPGVLTVVVAECESGWTRFGGKCYKEVTRSEPVDWRDAMQTCSQVNYKSRFFKYLMKQFRNQVAPFGFHPHFLNHNLWLIHYGIWAFLSLMYCITILYSRSKTSCSVGDYCKLVLGVKKYDVKYGFITSDNSQVAGIPIFLSKQD